MNAASPSKVYAFLALLFAATRASAQPTIAFPAAAEPSRNYIVAR